MMIDDQPTPLTLTVSKAKPRGDRHWLTITDIGKGVVPSVDRRFAVDSNAVLADSNPYLRLGRHAFEIIANRFWRVAQGRRNRAPQHRLRIVEGKHPLRIAAVEGLRPCLRRCRHLLLRPCRRKCRYAKREEHSERGKHALHGTSPSVTALFRPCVVTFLPANVGISRGRRPSAACRSYSPGC